MLLLAASEQAGNDERAGTQKVVATRTFRTPIRKLSGIGHVRSHGQVLGESSTTLTLPADGRIARQSLVMSRTALFL
jgi:hypothetical protein